MNKYKGKNYTLLKNNWKLILEDKDKVNFYKFICNRSFKSYVTRRDIFEYLLDLDKIFKSSYERVYDIRRAVKFKNKVELKRLIESATTGLSESLKIGINTMRKYKDYILNSIKYDISNGPLEVGNNKIKVLKRISYGYRSFYNFRLRILVVSRLFVSKHKDKFNINEHGKKTK